jgi:hypothetical protein
MRSKKCVPLGLAPVLVLVIASDWRRGHVEAMKRSGSGIEPIYPQQSIREMTRTNRTAQQVMDEAMEGASALEGMARSGPMPIT